MTETECWRRHLESAPTVPPCSARIGESLEGLKRAQMVEYIEPDELAQLIRKKVIGEHELLIIDVRTGDYGHGHIRGSIHLNFDFVQANPKSVAAMIKSYNVVVFHCMYSQSRGPSCASLLFRTLKSDYPESETRIMILKGGYATFASLYRNDSYLLEDFDPGLFDELSE